MLPIKKPKPDGATLATPARSGTRAGPLMGRVALVVDPDPEACALVVALLARAGARAIVATDVAEALGHVEVTLFDVVITDIALPDRDGYALLEELRVRCPGLPVVAVTGFLTPPRTRARKGARFDGFVVKPFDPAKLFACLADLLSRGEEALEG